MTPDIIFLQHVLNGLAAGTLYALVAVGLTMTYGILHITNFAHGEFMTVGAIVTYAVAVLVGLSFPVAVLAGALAAAALGVAVERTLFRPTLSQPITALVVSIGLITVLQNGLAIIAGPQPVYVEQPLTGVVDIGGVRISLQRLVSLGVGIIAIALTGILLRHTSVGRTLRALAVDPKAALLVGVRPGLYYAIAFAVGCLLAGLAGALLAPLIPVHPFMGSSWVAKAFIIIVLGGLGSYAGAVVGGLAIGLIEALGGGYLSSTFTDAFGFLALIILLIFRPSGLFGIVERRA